MTYNLTPRQKDLLRWIVREVEAGRLDEEFRVHWMVGGILNYPGEQPEFTQGALEALTDAGLILSNPTIQYKQSRSGSRKNPKYKQTPTESSRGITLLGPAYDAVKSDFDAPDSSFVRHLTPLAEGTGLNDLDEELRDRCVILLPAGGMNPKVWDSVVRTAVVVLEERLRDVGGIADEERIGRGLVNEVFGKQGSLAGNFSDSEREGYRDLYAGMVGVFRNVYTHRIVDPTPEDAGAFIVFVNLLLKRLEDLRQAT